MFLDTSGLLCLLDRKERFHVEACAAYETAPFRLTHNLVLAEFVALAHVRHVSRSSALIFISDLIEDQEVETIWVEESLHRRAIDLLGARQDKSYSLCDAVSFILMRERGIHEALTTDRHFEQEGFRRLPM
jgi:predicted nucleic acid-binding protein